MASKLEALARGMRQAFYVGQVGPMEEVAHRLESPLEAAVFWALVNRLSGVKARLDVPTKGLPGAVDDAAPAVEMFGAGTTVTVWPQLDVKAGEDVYRVDLAIAIADRRAGKRAIVVAELDGHDFHERTKEQAERDRRRDRDLQALGWKVARFTGSQAHRDIVGVVEELLGFAEQVAEPVAVGG
jgi:hypothetical protein